MSIKISTLQATIILVGTLVSFSSGGFPHKIKCLDAEIDVKDMWKGRMECSKEHLSPEDLQAMKDPDTPKDKKKEIFIKSHQNMCIMVCQLKKQIKILNDDGTMNKGELDKFIDATFPEAARGDLKTGIMKCHEDNGKKLDDKNQCESYKQFGECLMKTFITVCKFDTKGGFMNAMPK